MEKIEYELESVCPMKQDKWIETEGKEPKTEKEYLKQAEQKVYRDSKGNAAIPTNAIKASMRLASSELGKKMQAKKNRQSIAAGVFFDEEFLSLGKKTYDAMAKDVVTRKGTGDKVTRVTTFRPLFKKWKVSGTMNLFNVQPDFAYQALELGGIRFGLLGHRPEFGRFIIKRWVIKNGTKQ